ncbi:hypothetical protein [Candidatus Protochlamydia phocaeensis]|uniref:hypothetical protein n=1 Tax=Candidatus Protochlamydia phocaeensis TaxID=1414722 RepID=UPI000837BA7B|nr:hypothetical protein [Candidatus Protochlamydia phocaeensis]
MNSSVSSSLSPLFSASLSSSEQKVELKDKTTEAGQEALNQLALMDEASCFSLDEAEWEIIPDQQKEQAAEILTDQEKLQTLIETIVNLDGEEWILVEDERVEFIQAEEGKSNWKKQWAITGGIPVLGATVGTIQQLAGSKAGLSVLQGLNLLKQIEIKNCAYILPAAPIFVDLAQRVYQDSSSDSFQVKVIRAAKSLDKKELAFNLLSCGLSLGTAGMHGAMMKAGLVAFDLSGHIMTKVVSSAILAKGVTSAEGEDKPSLLKKAALYLYVASDALMLHKTALRFHTPEEVVAGALWGLINLGVAQAIANRLTAPSIQPETEPSSPEILEEQNQEPTNTLLTQEGNLTSHIQNEQYFDDNGEKEAKAEEPEVLISKHTEDFTSLIQEDYFDKD